MNFVVKAGMPVLAENIMSRGAFVFLSVVVLGLVRLEAQPVLPTSEELRANPAKAIREISRALKAPGLSYDHCVTTLRGLYPLISQFKPSDIPVERRAIASTSHDHNPRYYMPSSSRELQEARFRLAELLRAYYLDGSLKPDDVQYFRAGMRLFRTFDEEMSFYVEWILNQLSETSQKRWWKNRSDRMPSRGQFVLNHHLVPDSETSVYLPNGEIDVQRVLRNGDIILARGRPEKSVSSTIATIASQTIADSQFSHALIVRKSAEGIVRLEALIEDGTQIRSWEEFEKGDHVRYLVLRFSDPTIIDRGVEKLYQAIRARLQAGNQIRYNFSMKPLPDPLPEMLWDVDIFCSQPGRLAVLMGSDGAKSIPKNQTRISMDDPWLLNMLGIENNRFIEHPGDYEVEPDLMPVMEFRDPLLAHESFLGQAIMTFIFEKLNKGYRIRPDRQSLLVREGLWRLRRAPTWMWRWIPYLGKLEKAFPEYITQDQIQAITSLQSVFKKFFIELRRRDDLFMSQARDNAGGITLSWDQLREVLDRIYSENISDVQHWLYFENPEKPAPKSESSAYDFSLFAP